MEDILRNIRVIRESRGFSQEQMADLMKISQSQYARFERGATKTDLDSVFRFCEAIHFRVIDLFTYPKVFIDPEVIGILKPNTNEIKTTLQIELGAEQKEQVLKLVLGENYLEILKK